MKALFYKITIHESVIAMVHGFGEAIKEVYIPKLKIAFNEKNSVFKTNSSRYESATDITEIELDDDFVNVIQNCVKVQETFEKAATNFFANLK